MPKDLPRLAFREWLELIDVPDLDDAAAERLDRAEYSVLKHRPSDAAEAVMILEVLAESIAAGGRSDGLDNIAAHNVKIWLGGTFNTVAAAQKTARALARAVAA